jgi:hypothetical protein
VVVGNPSRFRIGDQLRVQDSSEMLLVTDVDTGTGALTLSRGYGGTASGTLDEDLVLHNLGNAALEGGDAGDARVTVRARKSNYTQIFSVTVEVSGSELAVRQIGVRDELDYQKLQRTRELLRDLENSVINGIPAAANPQGSSSVRRTMRGIVASITDNSFIPGAGGFPAGEELTEVMLNTALRNIWQSSNGSVDLLVMGGLEKRSLNNFIGSSRRFSADTELYKNLVSAYESDYGVCRVIVSRYVPTGTVLLLDSSRISVLPLAGRSFQYKPLARTGDRESGQLVGEYTVELRNSAAHGVISGIGAGD